MKIQAIVLCLLGISSFAFAQLDEGSRNLLIEKLQKVNQNLAPNDPAKPGVTLRLADLYSERARLESMKELEAGCEKCVAGTSDRKKALQSYLDVLNRIPADSKGKVFIQVGHLYELQGQDEQAAQFYRKVISESANSQIHSDAHLSLAEMAFKKNRYQEAISSYEKVIENPQAASKGLATYRLAWSNFHLGNTGKAISSLTNILTNQDLLSKGTGQNIDSQFQEEVSHDLALFYAKIGFDQAVVKQLWNLSPEKARMANMIALASESERSGKKQAAMMAWEYAYSNQKSPRDRAESLAHIVSLAIESNLATKAMDSFNQFQTEAQAGCAAQGCEDLRKLIRASIVNWNQLEKTNPSSALMDMYQAYVNQFPQDQEMMIFFAQNSRILKQHDKALSLYDKATASYQGKELENSLLTMIEIGEDSKSDDLLLKAQDAYLTRSIVKSKFYEVRYQKAHRKYEQNQLDEAIIQLKGLAMDSSGPMKLRLQAADLTLDAFAIQKNNKAIQTDALVFASLFADKKKEYTEVAQKALLTEVAEVAKSDLQMAWVRLASFNENAASPEDKVVYLRNKIVIAEKSNRISDGLSAVNQLLALKNISAADQEFANSRKAWFSELMLDFKSALEATEKMSVKTNKEEEVKALRLALFADLSGQNPVGYYQKVLKSSQDAELKASVAKEIIKRSSNQTAELENQKAVLGKNPEEYARLIGEIYVKTPSLALIKKMKSEQALASSVYGKLLLRTEQLGQLSLLKKEVEALQLDSSTQGKLKKSIQARGKALDKVEGAAQAAISSGDWTSQLFALDLVAVESKRFYQDLMSLPIPEGLSPEEESEYMNLLSQQSAPFKLKADAASLKVSEFWANPDWKNQLKASIANAGSVRPLFKTEIEALSSVASADNQAFLGSLSLEPDQIVSVAMSELEDARNQVRSNPMSVGEINRLLELEKTRKNFAMVQYLEGRIEQLNKKGDVK